MKSFTSWFKGLRGKLLASAIFPIAGFVLIGALNIFGLQRMSDMLSLSYEDLLPGVEVLGDMITQRQSMGYYYWASMSTADQPEVRAEFLKQGRHALESFKKSQAAYEGDDLSPEEVTNYAKVKETKEEFFKLSEEMFANLEKNTPEADKAVRAQLLGRWRAISTMVREGAQANMAIHEKIAHEGTKQKDQIYREQLNITIFASLFAVFTLIGILMWMAQRIANNVGQIAGSLTTSGQTVTTAIQQLNAAGTSLSQTSTQAAASLEETVASLEEMSSMVKMNSDNAKQASALSQSSRESAEEGEKEIHNLISSMKDISQSSKKIEEIIVVIDDIAFQTNLLALNAAVEAARAGEQGKGFAVVAEAVRALAQRSAVAAKDINNLIKDSVDKIDRGTKIADKSGSVLNNIVTSVKKVADLNNEISTASQEQATGISQVGQAMNQLDHASQGNAASAEEISASSEEILKQAQFMQSQVFDLNALILGGRETVAKDSAVEKKERKIEKEAVKAVAKTPAPTPVKKSSANVIKFETKQSAPKAVKTGSAAVIPFDEDEVAPTGTDASHPRAKLGNTDGF